MQPPYDIVFMDWRMPGVDGTRPSRTLRATRQLAANPTSFVKPSDAKTSAKKQSRLQLDGFLVKPVTRSMIVDSLVIFCRARRHSSNPEQFGVPPETRINRRPHPSREDNDINQQLRLNPRRRPAPKSLSPKTAAEASADSSDGSPIAALEVVLEGSSNADMDGYQARQNLVGTRVSNRPIIA